MMTLNKPELLSVVTICFFILVIVNNGDAQGCCGIGGSLVSGGHPVLNRNSFLVNVSGSYADAKKPERRRGSVGLLLAYGITDRLSLSLQTSYIRATYSPPLVIPALSIDSVVTHKNNGFGDGYAAVQYAVVKMTPVNKQELVTGMDVGIPWGPYSKKVDGVELPGNVQTGTGGFSVNGFLTYLKAFPTIHYAVSSTIAGRVNFKTLRSFDPDQKERKLGKDPGDELSILLTSLLGPFFNARGSLTFSYYRKWPTYDRNHLDPNRVKLVTSGQRLSLVPALEYSILSNLRILINADLPLWREGSQIELSNDRLFAAGVYWFIGKPGTASTEINIPQLR